MNKLEEAFQNGVSFGKQEAENAVLNLKYRGVLGEDECVACIEAINGTWEEEEKEDDGDESDSDSREAEDSDS